MLCSKCKKNRAVIFVKKLENGKAIDEGYCFACAKELGIAPINDMIEKMGLSEEDIENMEDQFSEMMEMIENGEMPEELASLGGMNFMNFGMSSKGEGETLSQKGEKENKDKNKKNKKKSLVDTFGTNLNIKAKNGEIDRIIGREKELSRVIQILNRRTKNNPALIGEPGVGKTAIAEALALKIVEQKVPAKLLDKKVYLVDFTALVAGTQFRGQFEARVKGIIEEVKADGNIILVIDEVHNIVGGGGADGALNAANILTNTSSINTINSKLNGVESGAQKNTVTGVKGSSESSYRTGNINITPANLGITVVNNTADSNKSVKYATSAGSATTAGTCTGNSATATSANHATSAGNSDTVDGFHFQLSTVDLQAGTSALTTNVFYFVYE